MNWMEIVSVIFLVAMAAMIFPGARRAVKEAPKGSMKDWMGYIVPMAAVILFIMLLISMV